jgi:hypothetical protein
MPTNKKSLRDEQSKSTQNNDDPSSAPESGDPKESGRSQGRVIDKSGSPAGQRTPSDKGGDTDLESGRHGTK